MDNNIIPITDYYCSYKFKYLKIDLQKDITYNCHAAAPHKIDYEWLKNNPGELFNTDINVNERQQMLDNQRPLSCEQNCWYSEERGIKSPRIIQGGKQRDSVEIKTKPKILDITIDFNCNLTCSYCTKEFSSSWTRDILENGKYLITDYNDKRYEVDTRDQVLFKSSQKEIQSSKNRNILFNEIHNYVDNLDSVDITGGEPLLTNELIDLLKILKDVNEVRVYSGLGMSWNRFYSMIDKIKKFPNVVLYISMENIKKNLEFNRYGIKWEEIEKKINHVKDINLSHVIQGTLSNLTLFGFKEFYEYFSDRKIIFSFCTQPTFMSPNVLDDISKETIIKDISNSIIIPDTVKLDIKNALISKPTKLDQQQLKDFILEFTKRRKDLSLDIYPESFVKWMNVV